MHKIADNQCSDSSLQNTIIYQKVSQKEVNINGIMDQFLIKIQVSRGNIWNHGTRKIRAAPELIQ